MPSREQLLAKLLGTMQAPIARFAQTINEVPAKLARTLAAVRARLDTEAFAAESPAPLCHGATGSDERRIPLRLNRTRLLWTRCTPVEKRRPVYNGVL